MSVEDSVKLLASLDPQLACISAQAWGKLDSVGELCEGSMVEGEEVRVWAVRVMREVVGPSSLTQLLQKCSQWRATLISALKTSTSAAVLAEVSGCVSSLVTAAHSTGLRDFSTVHLPPLLSSLLQFREASPCLQSAVLPAVSTVFHCYPMACKTHRSAVLQWGKEGLMNSDLCLSRESARLLVVTHQNPAHWTLILSSSLSSLSSSLLHFSLTLSQTTPLPEDLNLGLPPSEPSRSTKLLGMITSHCRLLSHLLCSPSPSALSLPLGTLVGVVTFGLRIGSKGVATVATDSTLLLALLPLVHSSLLTLLTSLITSSHSHLLPFSTAIDSGLLRQMSNEGCVVWRRCVSGAVCAWARVRGEGGKGDWFVGPVVQWFLKCCRSGDQGQIELGLSSLSVVMGHCPIFLPPHLKQEVCDMVFETLSSSLPSNVALAGVRLLRRCLEYPSSTPLPRAVRVLQNLARHSSSEVCEESRQGLALCSLLLHPVGPTWGSRSGPISEGVPPNQLSVDLMDVQPSTLPTFPPSAPGVNYTAANGPLQEPRETLTQRDSRKRRREKDREASREKEEADIGPASTEDCCRVREKGERRKEGKRRGEGADGGRKSCRTVCSGEGRDEKEKGEGLRREEGKEEEDAVLGSGQGKRSRDVRKEGHGGNDGEKRAGELRENYKEDKAFEATKGLGGGEVLSTEEGERGGRKEGGGDGLGDEQGVVVVEEGGGEEGEKGGEEGEREGGWEDDSDVEDIIATFCSSPSNTDSSS